MTIHVAWENAERTLARWTFEGNWTWDEFAAIQTEFHNMLRQVDHTVDVIADLRSSKLLPKDTITNFKRAETKILPNRGSVVLVTTSGIVRSLAATFNRIFTNRPTRFLLATSMPEAQRMLQQVRAQVV